MFLEKPPIEDAADSLEEIDQVRLALEGMSELLTDAGASRCVIPEASMQLMAQLCAYSAIVLGAAAEAIELSA
ncbi:MAG: hypothetical protein HFJ73_01670 [Eggerthellaceae bacterium]|jgi:hypothetical protein|nr:hypothetical protein [Eggerthellaceae bacterium]